MVIAATSGASSPGTTTSSTGHESYLPPVAADRAAETPLSHLIDDETATVVAPQVPVENLEQIRQDFESEVTAGGYSVDHPQYELQWKRAQMTAGQRIKSLYGDAAYAEFQRKLYFEKLAAQGAGRGQ